MTAAAAATTVTTTAAATATGTFLTRTRLVHGDLATIKLFAVHLGDRLVGLFLTGHFHERESAGLVRHFILDQVARVDVPNLLEQVQDVVLRRVE